MEKMKVPDGGVWLTAKERVTFGTPAGWVFYQMPDGGCVVTGNGWHARAAKGKREGKATVVREGTALELAPGTCVYVREGLELTVADLSSFDVVLANGWRLQVPVKPGAAPPKAARTKAKRLAAPVPSRSAKKTKAPRERLAAKAGKPPALTPRASWLAERVRQFVESR